MQQTETKAYTGKEYQFLPALLDFDEKNMSEEQKLIRKRTEAVDAQIREAFEVGGRILNITNRTVAKIAIKAITENYPNPANFGPGKDEAISDYGDMVLSVVNLYVETVHAMMKKKSKPNAFSSIEAFMVKEIIFGYFDVFHFIPDKGMNGVGMILSKKAEDPNEKFLPLDPIIGMYASALLSTSYKTDNMSTSCKQDPRTIEHITSPREENPLIKEASPFANGVYIPEFYKKNGRLLTYREAYEEYGLFFTYCFAANYLGPNNPPPVMSDGWKPDEWMKETYATSPEKEQQFMAMTLSILRPYDSRYDKAYFLQDDGIGRTGKGTTTALFRAIVGDGHYASISLKQLDGSSTHRFALEQLAGLNICLIIYDENDPKTDYLEDAANFKCACTGDPIYVDRKNRPAISIIFRGRIVQCINGRIGSKDNTPSLMRRILIMMFTHKIGRGDVIENKDIKSRWMQTQEVIDWFATEAINRSVLHFPETEETDESLHEMDRQNNHVLRFIEDELSRITQNWFTPSDLYPAFCEFCKHEHLQVLKKTTFESEAAKILARPESDWTFIPRKDYPGKLGTVKIGQYNVPLEYLAGEIVKTETVCSASTVKEETVPYNVRCKNYRGPLRDDPVFDLLTYVTCEGSKSSRRTDNYKNALDAITNLYHTSSSTSKRAYFRKPEAEIENLVRFGNYLINTPDEMTDKMAPSDILRLLSENMQYRSKDSMPGIKYPCVDADKSYYDQFETKDHVLCYNRLTDKDEIKLRNYVVDRLKTLCE
jgi:P4 family phage/plasmid primase-like protien